MPVVLVHGVPETPAVWDPLRSKLSRDDVVALQLPGFGCPRPEASERPKRTTPPGWWANSNAWSARSRSTWSATTGAAGSSCDS